MKDRILEKYYGDNMKNTAVNNQTAIESMFCEISVVMNKRFYAAAAGGRR